MSLFTDEERKALRTSKKKPRPEPVTVVGTIDQGQTPLPVSVVADQFTDQRMAAMFAEMFKDVLRYWPETGKWLVFDGQRWTTDAPGGAFPFFRRMIDTLYARALSCSDLAMKADMLKAILKLEAYRVQETILSAAKTRPELIITAAELDRHSMLLTIGNGTIELKNGTLQAHRAEDFMTRLVPIAYDPAARCPLFLTFLNRIFDGNQGVIDYLRRFAGYCLTGQTGEQILLFLYGLGCNGKSVLANVLGALLGDFASTATSDLLMARDRRGATCDVAALRGARVVKVSEFDDGERLAEAQIKTLSGGDPVTCRHLYGEFFSYVPAYKIILIGNHKPKIRGTDHGIWRRLHLLDFRVTIPEQERDPLLQDKLAAELPGILAWAVQGCLEWQKVGLCPPDGIKAAVDEYRRSEDIFQQWLADSCTLGEHLTTLANDLLNSFIQFSKWRNTTPQKLGRMLTEAGFIREKSSVTRWRGLGLLPSNQDSQDQEAPF